MKDPLKTGFNDRIAAAAEAKKAMLARMKPKPTVTDPNFVDRATRKALEVEAIRAQRAAEKEAAKAAAEARRLAEIEARAEAAETELEAKRRERKERKAAAKEEARLKKEMKRAH
ncbi:MAG: hypothetical protein EON95_01010 [Caulobacteraceae bacterium]|nr:MAG: hypothetical protein EON95_01010 [Caulobacteraceae bacterium]